MFKMPRGRIFFALVTRFLFFSHTFLVVGLDYMNRGKADIWFVMLALGAPLLVETIIIIAKRRGHDYMYFWPSCFLYLSALLPVIWIMELDLLHHNLEKRDQLESKLENPSSPSIKIEGLDIKAVLDNDIPAKKVGELGMIIIIIIGRWLLPRGQLTRDQLSALLLGYIATGADILDIFSSLASDKIAYNIHMHYAILVAFSWSMYQFCITATVSAGSEAMTTSTVDPELGRDSANGQKDSGTSTKKDSFCCCTCNADLLQIFVPLLMQDGPFLVLRVFMWAKYEVSDELHLYFTGKNALTLTLLLYRLYCLKAKDHPEGGGARVSEIGLENPSNCLEVNEHPERGDVRASEIGLENQSNGLEVNEHPEGGDVRASEMDQENQKPQQPTCKNEYNKLSEHEESTDESVDFDEGKRRQADPGNQQNTEANIARVQLT